ncbi:MAG: glycosyltransferase family 4 protein [Prevotellaceae bacterium]|jgi:glycosyltransferase involved in cell wall biosynthesis|nr:glycosyltransferase family 4 protein [Prevotellaceae bacterium]
MLIIFYQNILSIHQSAFIRNIAEKHDVTLVVQEKIEEPRKKHGWTVHDFGKTKIVVNPDDAVLNSFLEQKDAIHVFSGIDSFPLPAKAFKIAVKNRLKMGIYSEPFNWLGWKGKLRFLKYVLLNWKYGRHLDFILAVGNRGRWCYEKTGFPKEKIFDWGYFTEMPQHDTIQYGANEILNILFIGSIDTRKNILVLVDVCLSLTDSNPFVLNIIGTGHLENELREKIKTTDRINYIGSVPNNKIPEYLVKSDLLILPSVFDGWGAVVNEALMCGTPVIASENCGSSVLLKDGRGRVFSVKENNLEQILCEFLQELPYGEKKRNETRNWANENISGKAAAEYFEDIMSYTFNKRNKRPGASWID